MRCPDPPDDAEREHLREEGRQRAIQGLIEGEGYVAFTDGLGAMGVGSWVDGPASERTAGYKAALAELTEPIPAGDR